MPGRLVFDLDPAPDVAFDAVVSAALELKDCLGAGPCLKRLPPDHEKAGTGVADPDESAALDHRVRIIDLEDVF